MKIGLQLYTLRDACARDFHGTLQAVAGLGFEGVELFDLHGHDASTVRSWLDGLGLEVAGRHAGLEALEGDFPALALELHVLGCDRVALAWVDQEQAAALVPRIGALAHRAEELGLRFGFHNHWAEVPDLLEELSAYPLWLELDLGWVWWSGADPIELLERYRGRTPLVHVKDLRARGVREFAPVGDGGVGYAQVLPVAVELGVEWLLVEQDETDGSPFDAVARSLAFVRQTLGVSV